MMYSGCTYAYRDSAWECSLDNFPTDVSADLPFCGGGNQYNPSVDGMSEAHIENGIFTCETRTAGFDDTGHEPFIFAFLVRDVVTETEPDEEPEEQEELDDQDPDSPYYNGDME